MMTPLPSSSSADAGRAAAPGLAREAVGLLILCRRNDCHPSAGVDTCIEVTLSNTDGHSYGYINTPKGRTNSHSRSCSHSRSSSQSSHNSGTSRLARRQRRTPHPLVTLWLCIFQHRKRWESTQSRSMKEMVIIATAMFTSLLLSSWSSQMMCVASAQPIGPPDLDDCDPSSCCLPSPTVPASAFARNSSIPFHTRRALQNVLQDTAYLSKLNDAYAKLREVSSSNPDDPRGLSQQRHLHCAFCSRDLPYGRKFNMHGNWFFFPWHRMLLYYHERILAWACGDDSFALPFWNWDNSDGRAFPAPYADPTSSLYTEYRRAVDSVDQLIDRHVTTASMRRDVMNVSAWNIFMGTAVYGSFGTLEGGAHGIIHSAVGMRSLPWREMGSLAWAGNDPVFYAHHANVDRLWSVWRRLPGRSDPSSSDFLDSKFVFYDENAIAKVIAVSDVLDYSLNLRYDYEDITHDWIIENSRSGVARAVAVKQAPVTFRAVPISRPNVVTAYVQSPDPKPAPGLMALLRFVNVRHTGGQPLELHVFLNEPKADVNTAREGNPHYAGDRFLLAGTAASTSSFSLPLGLTLDNLGLTLSSNFSVQVVRGEDFTGVRAELSMQFVDYVHQP